MQLKTRFVRSEEDIATPVVVSRQPILDHLERIVAFELLTQDDASLESTASLLAHAFGDIGLPRLEGARAVHINVGRDFLLAVRPLPLDPARVVLEVDAGQPADEALLLVLREAREGGFRIALDGFRAETDGLLEFADSVKLDVAAL